jgi:hypothetical protein
MLKLADRHGSETWLQASQFPAFSRIFPRKWGKRVGGTGVPPVPAGLWPDGATGLPLLRNRIRERRFPCVPDPIAEASGGTPAATGREACSTHNFPSRFLVIPTRFDLFRPKKEKSSPGLALGAVQPPHQVGSRRVKPVRGTQ